MEHRIRSSYIYEFYGTVFSSSISTHISTHSLESVHFMSIAELEITGDHHCGGETVQGIFSLFG